MKPKERVTKGLLEAAKQIERGVTTVHIKLAWGDLEWRASYCSIIGRSKNGTPFAVGQVTREGLLLWLRGTKTLEEAFPKMERLDRQLIELGYV